MGGVRFVLSGLWDVETQNEGLEKLHSWEMAINSVRGQPLLSRPSAVYYHWLEMLTEIERFWLEDRGESRVNEVDQMP